MAENEAKVTLGLRVQEYLKNLKQASTQMQDFGKQVEAQRAQFAGFAKAAGVAALGLGAVVETGRRVVDVLGHIISATGKFESSQASFEILLGGADKAAERIKLLQKEAASTPNSFEDLSKASVMLETITNGALATGKGLRLVGDAAAVAGRPISEVALHMGRLYSGIQSGRPVGEAAQELQQLGVISGDTRNMIEMLQKEGKKGPAVWDKVAESFERFAGTMERRSRTLEGTASTIKDEYDLAAASVGNKFAPALIKARFAYIELLKAGRESDAGALAGAAMSEAYEEVARRLRVAKFFVDGVTVGWAKARENVAAYNYETIKSQGMVEAGNLQQKETADQLEAQKKLKTDLASLWEKEHDAQLKQADTLGKLQILLRDQAAQQAKVAKLMASKDPLAYKAREELLKIDQQIADVRKDISEESLRAYDATLKEIQGRQELEKVERDKEKERRLRGAAAIETSNLEIELQQRKNDLIRAEQSGNTDAIRAAQARVDEQERHNMILERTMSLHGQGVELSDAQRQAEKEVTAELEEQLLLREKAARVTGAGGNLIGPAREERRINELSEDIERETARGRGKGERAERDRERIARAEERIRKSQEREAENAERSVREQERGAGRKPGTSPATGKSTFEEKRDQAEALDQGMKDAAAQAKAEMEAQNQRSQQGQTSMNQVVSRIEKSTGEIRDYLKKITAS